MGPDLRQNEEAGWRRGGGAEAASGGDIPPLGEDRGMQLKGPPTVTSYCGRRHEKGPVPVWAKQDTYIFVSLTPPFVFYGTPKADLKNDFRSPSVLYEMAFPPSFSVGNAKSGMMRPVSSPKGQMVVGAR